MKKELLITVGLCLCFVILNAQQNLDGLSWRKVACSMPDTWYGTEQAKHIADKVLLYQTEIGGWPKNTNFHTNVNSEEMSKIRTSGIGATFDNEATIMEMRFLAKIYTHRKEEKYRNSFLKAFNYILYAQYDNGGWPQFCPVRKGKSVAYSGHITYNDGAYVNIMNLLKDIYEDAPSLSPLELEEKIKKRARQAFDKGVECILKTQIQVNGLPTVWCAQHDEQTLKPAKARAYELPSFSGAESVGIVLLLMKIPNPSPEIIASIKGAVKWFDEHKIVDMKFERYRDEQGERNARLVPSKGERVWGRFYDLETEKPFVCDRDGVKKDNLNEIGKERRGGYTWYDSAPDKVLDAYPEWLMKITSKE